MVDLKVLSILIAMLIPKYLDESPGRRVASVFIDQIGIPLSLSLDGDDFVTPENMLLARGDFPKEKTAILLSPGDHGPFLLFDDSCTREVRNIKITCNGDESQVR